MERFEELAKDTAILVRSYQEQAEKVGAAVQTLTVDPTYSEYGRNKLMNKLRQELAELNATTTEVLKGYVKEFLQLYSVERPEVKADSQDVANALKVIEMCGFSLTVEVLKAALEPLKNSYTALNMIRELLISKNSKAITDVATYSYGCIELLNDLTGVNDEIVDYEREIEGVKEVLDMPLLFNSGVYGETRGGSVGVINYFTCDIPYCVMCLGDTFMRVGKKHGAVKLSNPNYFK